MATNTDPNVSAARRFIGQLQAGEYQQAAADFDKAMSEAMPPDALKGGWEQVQQQAGKYQEAQDATVDSQDGYRVVVVKLKFENAAVACRIVFDQAGKIAGMGFGPA